MSCPSSRSSMTEPSVRLAVDGLRVVQRGTEVDVVDEVCFALPAGKTLGLVGESGSGKTTVALALLGFARRGLEIAAGTVKVEGEDVLAMGAAQIRDLRGSRVAYVPQDPASALHPALKVTTQLDEVLTGHSRGSVSEDGRRRVAEVLDEVRLDGRAVLGAYPHQLSGGQQQRVVLAMAFMLRPSVIVLDEPTTGLDVSTQRHVLDTIRVLCQIHDVSAIFVSHDLAVIADLVDDVAVMYSGRVIELGSKAEVFGAPAHPYTRALIESIPKLGESNGRLTAIDGQPPDPADLPGGCAFHPRCPRALEKCATELPRNTIVGAEHRVACWLHG